MNMRPVYVNRFRDSLRGMCGFYIIFIVIMTLCMLGARADGRFFMTGAYEMAAAVTLFVHGITSIREDLRLASQNGVGRRTALIGSYLASLTLAAIVTIAGEVLCALFVALTAGMDNMVVSTLYGMLYSSRGTGFAQRLESMLLAFAFYAIANLTGSLISMLFYRLNRIGRIAVAVGAPIILFTVLPVFLVRAGVLTPRLFQLVLRVISSPVILSVAFLLSALVSGGLAWLLTRKAPIRAAK